MADPLEATGACSVFMVRREASATALPFAKTRQNSAFERAAVPARWGARAPLG
jgi:hypothetical protein